MDEKTAGKELEPILIPEPIRSQLPPDEIEARSLVFFRRVVSLIENAHTEEGFKSELEKILTDISNLIGQKTSLEEFLKSARVEEEERKKLLSNLQEKIDEKSEKFDKLFLDKVYTAMYAVKERAILIATIISIGGSIAAFAYHFFDGINTTPDEQIIIDEKYAQIRSQIVATLERIGTAPDLELKVGEFSFRRRTQDVAFSERNFFNSEDYYQLDGRFGEFETFIAIPFKAPNNIVIGIGDFKRELTNPTTEDIEYYLQLAYDEQEQARLDKIANEAEASSEAQRLAAIEAENEMRRAEEAALESQLEEENMLREISESQSRVLETIVRLSGNETASLSSPFDITLISETGVSTTFRMLPEKGTGGITGDDYVSDNNVYTAEGEGSYNFDDDDYIFKLTIKIDVFGENNIEVEVNPVDARGYVKMNENDFNGQDVSVLLETIRNHIYSEM